jgi:SNF2 family DNA or RNA helicase
VVFPWHLHVRGPIFCEFTCASLATALQLTCEQLFDFGLQVLLTTYEVAIADASLLSSFKWQAIIVDEGHRLRGTASKLKVALKVCALFESLNCIGIQV